MTIPHAEQTFTLPWLSCPDLGCDDLIFQSMPASRFSRVILVKPGKSQHETFPALPFPPKRGKVRGGREDHIYMSHSRHSRAGIPGRESLNLSLSYLQ